MGTMVNLFVGIRQAPPLIDTFIVPEVPGVLYALFDYGLTSYLSSKADQNFYITQQGKLVIVFDEYEVAPGFMGIVEFEILTALLADVLVSNEYIHD